MSEISRLRWLCRRGMKELDVLLTGYLESSYANASPVDQASFKALLEMPDPDLFALLTGRDTSDDNNITSLVQLLRTRASKK